MRAGEVSYLPSAGDMKMMREWKRAAIGRILVKHCPAFKNCNKFIK